MTTSVQAITSRLLSLTILFFVCASTACAENGFIRFLRGFDRWLEAGQRSGIDTLYQDVPKLNRQIYIGGYGYWQNYQMTMPFTVENLSSIVPGIRDDDRYEINAYSNQAELDIGIDWKGLALELPIPVFNNYLYSFGLAKNGSKWGFRFRYKNLKELNGRCNVGDQQVNNQTNKLRTFYAEGYYVLNSRKFSLSAGLFADMVQKRSAGSPLFYVNYYQSFYRVEKLFPATYDSFRTHQLSLGGGYAYNLSLLQGRLVFHGSLVPMVSVYSNMIHHAHFETEENKQQWADFYEAADVDRSLFRINVFARAAVNYSFDRYILSLLFNYRHFGYKNYKDLRIINQEADLQINFCRRF